MSNHNLIMKEILDSMGVSVTLHIPKVPDIQPVTNFIKPQYIRNKLNQNIRNFIVTQK